MTSTPVGAKWRTLRVMTAMPWWRAVAAILQRIVSRCLANRLTSAVWPSGGFAKADAWPSLTRQIRMCATWQRRCCPAISRRGSSISKPWSPVRMSRRSAIGSAGSGASRSSVAAWWMPGRYAVWMCKMIAASDELLAPAFDTNIIVASHPTQVRWLLDGTRSARRARSPAGMARVDSNAIRDVAGIERAGMVAYAEKPLKRLFVGRALMPNRAKRRRQSGVSSPKRVFRARPRTR